MSLNHKYKIFIWELFLLLLNTSVADATTMTLGELTEKTEVVSIQATVVDEDVNVSCIRNFTIYYKLNEAEFIPGFANNAVTMNLLSDFIRKCEADKNLTIQAITVTGSCSVDGPAAYNESLSIRRYAECLNYLQKHNINLSDYPIKVEGMGANWPGLKELAGKGQYHYKSQLMNILDSSLSDKSKQAELRKADNGQMFKYLCKNLFPPLRYTNIAVSYDSVVFQPEKVVVLPDNVYQPEVVEIVEVIEEPAWHWRPLLALKTNLLFDAMTALNVEVEVPIGKRWSVAGEWVFPWWERDRDRPSIKPCRLEVLCGTLEGRYWFGNRQERRVLTGWFGGAFVGTGLYDVQWKSKGYQSQFLITGGVSAGYAHRISRRFPNLSMEYSLGVGFMRTKYRHYEAFWGSDTRWHPVRLNNGRYTWIGPVRAKISLVWLINYKSTKGGTL